MEDEYLERGVIIDEMQNRLVINLFKDGDDHHNNDDEDDQARNFLQMTAAKSPVLKEFCTEKISRAGECKVNEFPVHFDFV